MMPHRLARMQVYLCRGEAMVVSSTSMFDDMCCRTCSHQTDGSRPLVQVRTWCTRQLVCRFIEFRRRAVGAPYFLVTCTDMHQVRSDIQRASCSLIDGVGGCRTEQLVTHLCQRTPCLIQPETGHHLEIATMRTRSCFVQKAERCRSYRTCNTL